MSSPLPPLYERWMQGLLGGPLPEEKRTDCLNCPKIRPREPSCSRDIQFHPDSKCCTYLPDIPNFLVGMILRDRSAEFLAMREQFERKMAGHLSVGPLGLYKSRERAFLQVLSLESFGRDPGRVCPFFVAEAGGLCGIWKYRNSRCSTWFCMYDRRAYGVGLWEDIYRLLSNIERSLASWNLSLIHPSPGNLIWGEWVGREAEYFEECARRVESLLWSEVLEISGQDAADLAQVVCNTFDAYQAPTLPDRLRKGSWNVELLSDHRCRVWAYSPFDSVDLDRDLLEALDAFQGQPVAEALATVRKKTGLKLDNALLRQLVDAWILFPEI